MSHPLPLILASASPRRRDLLASLGHRFEVIVSGIEERPWPNESPASYALRNASDKARAVQAQHPAHRERTILSADTIVVSNGRILEKPADAEDAVRMLRLLSGQRHDVITGLVVRTSERECGRAVRTAVTFRNLTDEEIRFYVETGEPMDKAGAYAIQGGAAGFVESIQGSHSNVVGLPVEAVQQLLESC